MKPFSIFGNLYFVGNADVGSYLIDTGDGLILIDTAYPTTRALLVQSIWEAGFNPGDIKYILHTHGHFDHFGWNPAHRFVVRSEKPSLASLMPKCSANGLRWR